MPADTVLLTSGDVGGVAVGVEEFDVAGGEAVPAQHRIDSTGVVGVPAAPRPCVPPARQQHRPVADLQSTRRQSTIVGYGRCFIQDYVRLRQICHLLYS